jgi:glucosamine--fructose-6-phosphate aminotransferase (isomerizing)
MTASSALRLAVTRRTLLSVAAGGRSAARATPRSPATAVRTVQSAAVATAAASTSANEGNESILRAMTLAALAAASAAVVGGATLNKEKTECTAIAAVVGKDGSNARGFLLDGLEKIKTRGYDGAGMATMSPTGGGMSIVKKSSPDDNVDPIQMVRDASRPIFGHSIGIAHTRWATHGSITDRNAHPHVDASGKIAVCHNGSIFNKQDLRKELKGLGYKFEGQTDTEVIAKLIGHYYESGKTDIRVATEKAMKRCEGTWGLVVMCSDLPEELVVTSHGSALYIGVGDNGTFVASNPSAFKGFSRNFIKLDDMEVATITVDGRNLDLTKQISSEKDDDEVASPAPYPHWFIKEVMEQPQAIGNALCFGGRLFLDHATLGGLDNNYEQLKDIESLSVVGCGSSFNAAVYGTKLLKHAGVFTSVTAMDANTTDDADFRVLSNPKKSGLIVISQSGETKEIIDVTQLALQRNVPVVSIVNGVGSTVANMSKCGVYTNAGQENAAPSTKTFTTEVVCLALVAMWFRQAKATLMGLKMSNEQKELAESLQRLPITFGMLMRTQSVCKKAAKKLLNKEHCFVLGKGFGEPIAMEGALKLKEVGYLHAEGYSGGALKHGPFAMIEDENGKNGGTPIIMLVLDDKHAHHMRTACEEVKARGAELIIITDNKKLADGLDDDPIIIPSNGPLTALGAIVPLQMIAYELAMLKDNNPDTPRNLLKSYSHD